ncbi:unnamed protein product [Heterosigma akashiwo]
MSYLNLSKKTKDYIVAGLFTAFAGCMMALPLYVTKKREGQNMLVQEEALSATQIRRGAYINSGSRDVEILTGIKTHLNGKGRDTADNMESFN